MDIKKLILYLAIALLGVMIWTTWQKDYPPSSVKSTTTTTPQAKTPESFTPPAYQPGTTTPKTPSKKTAEKVPAIHSNGGSYITVKTDVLMLKISEKGGNLISAKLLKYPISLKEKDIPIQLLTADPENIFLAQSGITNGVNSGKTIFKSQQQNYVLQPGQQRIAVHLTSKTAKGLLVTKTYTLEKGTYAIKEKMQVKNQSAKPWSGNFYHQLTFKNGAKHSFFSRSYTGAAISSPAKPYEKLSFKKLSKQNIDQNITGGWIAMQQPYFLGAWVPKQKVANHYYSQSFGQGDKGKGNTFVLGYVGPQVTVAPRRSAQSLSTIYLGPEIASQLNAVAQGLDLTIDYGWLWFLSKPIFWVMAKIHSVVGNWGWSIILVTLLIKILFYPLSGKSYKSMAKMRDVGPRLQTLKERYADDKKSLGKATMEFYKKEKVNPVGGCLPMLIQIPVFIALYYVLIESVQLRQAPFIFWIHDLSIKDPYYVLPILMGASMFLQQKLSPAPPDPTQAKMMMLLPVVFTVFFLSFPAGHVLYWVTNNCISILQQWYVMKTYDPKAEQQKKKKRR